MEINQSPRDTTALAEQPAFVENFSIEGLYGYRSVSLSSKFAATVLIARNGAGKTTLLAALDAFLRGQFTRFAGLEFESIHCKLRNVSEVLVLHRRDVDQLTDIAANSEIALRAKTWEIEPLALMEYLETGPAEFMGPDDHPILASIYSKLGYDRRLVKAHCEKLSEILQDSNENLDELRKTLRSALGGMEIVYLPTYRRIELSLPTPDTRMGGRKRTILSRLGVARSGLYAADIQFGLSDISDRLKSMYSEILYKSNQGYGKVSASIIRDLISGAYKYSSNVDLPTREALEIFFSRVKDAEREYRRIPYTPFNNLLSDVDLDKLYRGDVSPDAMPFLAYFLDQLNSVIKETSSSEQLVEEFIESCNRYLSGEDGSADMYGSARDFYDRKFLVFNRRNLSVKVRSLTTRSRVPLESLSSGEKQMISLFARLYLYPGPKLVLIDEPELSLSLDWQRKILPDVLSAPTCKQVIAITHSPFIFDNELEPFAGSLQLRINVSDELFQISEFSDLEDLDE